MSFGIIAWVLITVTILQVPPLSSANKLAIGVWKVILQGVQDGVLGDMIETSLYKDESQPAATQKPLTTTPRCNPDRNLPFFSCWFYHSHVSIPNCRSLLHKK